MNIKIDKIDLILYKSYESDIGIGKENYNYIMKFINDQQKEIEREKQYTDFYKDLCNKQQKIIKELQKDKKSIN